MFIEGSTKTFCTEQRGAMGQKPRSQLPCWCQHCD